MSVLSHTSSLVRNLLRRKHVEADLDEELRGYVALLAQEKIRDGMNADDARRAALIEAGGMERVKDDVRENTDMAQVPQVAWSAMAIATAMRSQVLDSARSCRRPAALSR